MRFQAAPPRLGAGGQGDRGSVLRVIGDLLTTPAPRPTRWCISAAPPAHLAITEQATTRNLVVVPWTPSKATVRRGVRARAARPPSVAVADGGAGRAAAAVLDALLVAADAAARRGFRSSTWTPASDRRPACSREDLGQRLPRPARRRSPPSGSRGGLLPGGRCRTRPSSRCSCHTQTRSGTPFRRRKPQWGIAVVSTERVGHIVVARQSCAPVVDFRGRSRPRRSRRPRRRLPSVPPLRGRGRGVVAQVELRQAARRRESDHQKGHVSAHAPTLTDGRASGQVFG